MTLQEYEELRVRACPVGASRYLLTASGPASAAEVRRLDEAGAAGCAARWEKLVEVESGLAPTGGRDTVVGVRELGREVHGLLFGGALGPCLEQAVERVKGLRTPRRLRVRFELPPGMRQLPVEALCAPPQEPMQDMALNPELSLVRSLPGQPPWGRLPGPEAPPSRTRLVVAVASPEAAELPPLHAEPEVAALLRGLPDVAFEVTVLEHASRRSLERELVSGPALPTAVLLIAHGAYDHERRTGQLCLEDDGRCDWMPASSLSGLLLSAPQLRLVALNVCFGADSTGAEPFSGLAQALIGNGLPAVVAMRGRVTGVSAGRFTPVLFEQLAANRTLDEAVAAARGGMAHLPGHTAIEWATPALFVHEEFRHGRLFRMREVRDSHETPPDPVQAGARAVRLVESDDGNVTSADVMAAARHLGTLGEWGQVLRKLRIDTERFQDEQRRMCEEARLERAWPAVRQLCAVLAEADAEEAERRLARLAAEPQGGLPESWAACLRAEVAELGTLAGLFGEARAAAGRGEWRTALERCEEVLAVRPAGFGGGAGVTGLRTAAEHQVRIDALVGEAARLRRADDWDAAERVYGEVLGHRPDDPDLLAGGAYASGRAAEARGHWRRAEAAYVRCPAGRPASADAPARAALVRGRAAADAGDWAAACAEFGAAARLGLVDAGWSGYAAGRAAEAAGRWAQAAEAFAPLRDDARFPDGTARLLLARGCAAAVEADWPRALAELDAAESHGCAVEPWRGRARAQVYARAVEAESAGDWPGAAGLLAALPDGYRDVAARAAYTAGRLAAAAGDWERAAEAYGRTGHADAEGRRRYASGRCCEERGDWAGAGELYAALARAAPPLPGAAERARYVRGRQADAEGDWAGVIDGFRGLPDRYAGGEVGVRRQYARAREAMARGERGAVLGLLDGIADAGREGGVGLLRTLARARRAEDVGDWRGALECYAARAGDEAGLGLRRRYARGRVHALDGRWEEALEAFAELPEGHRDVALWRGYARARLAERQAEQETAETGGSGTDAGVRWQRVCTAFRALPVDFEDVRPRTGYARARCAEEEADWPGAASFAGALGAYRDAPAVAGYARGRAAEALQQWERAADAFGEAGGRRDAAQRLAYARGRSLEAAGRWRAAVEAYGRARGGHEGAEVRRSRLLRLLELFPWAEELTRAALVADPFALEDPVENPYRALRDAGIGPGSTCAEVRDATYTLMERGVTMSWPERIAWKELRATRRRLRLDALLYRVHEPETLRARLADLTPGGGTDLLGPLCRQLPRDAPLLLLLSRGREAAVAEWERMLRAAPGDTGVLHGLAVARLWQARELEESGAWEHAVTVWEYALAYWATLLTDDGHWEGWRRERAACYACELSPVDTDRLRWELGQFLSDRLTAYEQRHTEAGRAEQADAYRVLGETLEAELSGARELGDVGGIPAGGASGCGAPGGGEPVRTLACGPGYVRLLGLELPLAELVARLDESARRERGPGPYAARELRLAFSELRPAHALHRLHKFDQALRALPPLDPASALSADCAGPAPGGTGGHLRECGHCADFLRRNPAYLRLPDRRARLLDDAVDLAVQVRLALARTALASGGAGGDGPGLALEQWREAITVARCAGMQVRTKRAVVRTALGRAKALTEENDAQQGERLDQAVRLVERVRELGPFDQESGQQLETTFAQLLSARGVWRGNRCEDFGIAPDFRAAESDLRRAVRVNPDALNARRNLAKALVSTLDERHNGASGKLAELLEVLEILHTGLERAPTYRRFLPVLREALEALEAAVLVGADIEEFRSMMHRLGDEPGAGSDLPGWARWLAGRAEEERRRGNRLWGLHYLIRAARADPADPVIRAALLDAAVRWRAEGPEGDGAREDAR
ncbi:CHAT domain-containing protein [Streptomyces sp. NRRL F-5053]|uniref:CHAT domain-containing protein n=1 Tax=Streptomyces sp. NRRL F-5053 TaxID=1463854 RepID=UPI0004C5B895|nr:CHAT domain-containing protein [Streptomyces sp. NRRL F-5053]